MKWFKHKTESLNDPDISDIMDKFGSAGYLTFFGVLELMGRNWNQNQDGKVTFSVKFLRKNLKISAVKLHDIFTFPKFSKRISSEWLNGEYTFYSKEFHTLLDNWTERQEKKEQPKLRSNSVVTTTLNRSKKEKLETDIDKESTKTKDNTLPGTSPGAKAEEFQGFKILFQDKWNDLAGIEIKIPAIISITEKSSRERNLRRLWGDANFRANLDRLFEEIKKSRFLCGRLEKPNPGHENFRITVDWLITNDKNWLKILEGNYRDTKSGATNWKDTLRNIAEGKDDESGSERIIDVGGDNLP